MIFAMIFWGASWISTKVLTNYVNEYELVFLRMGICFITMFPLIYFFKLSFKFDLKSFLFIASIPSLNVAPKDKVSTKTKPSIIFFIYSPCIILEIHYIN